MTVGVGKSLGASDFAATTDTFLMMRLVTLQESAEGWRMSKKCLPCRLSQRQK